MLLVERDMRASRQASHIDLLPRPPANSTGGVPRNVTEPSGQIHTQPQLQAEESARSWPEFDDALQSPCEIPLACDPPPLDSPTEQAGCTGLADGHNSTLYPPQEHLTQLHMRDIAECSSGSLERSITPQEADGDWSLPLDWEWEADTGPVYTPNMHSPLPGAASTADRLAAPFPAATSTAVVHNGRTVADVKQATPADSDLRRAATNQASRLRDCVGELDPTGANQLKHYLLAFFRAFHACNC
jgi:hypothetical protein